MISSLVAVHLCPVGNLTICDFDSVAVPLSTILSFTYMVL